MKNKTLKIVAILFIAIVLISVATTMVKASDTGFVDVTPHNPGEAGTKISDIAGQILYIVRMIGMAVAVVMLTVLGIKYVAASPNEKADYKKGMTVYVVGAVLLFGASMLLGVIQNFVTKVSA